MRRPPSTSPPEARWRRFLLMWAVVMGAGAVFFLGIPLWGGGFDGWRFAQGLFAAVMAVVAVWLYRRTRAEKDADDTA
ncbi:hypothetical protein AB0J74_24960 [Asanoa sp. NPDC049573]|uniref:hypothetical protein n=1 Tax=Asanoa sp. NPDC049573 TaxID=3155396 RepID=UPI00341EE753